ncbi:MAG: DUF2065 domain-containing protein [Pseudomonadota bacterium]
MDMTLLGSALALCLIFEGLMPFASPSLARRVYAQMLSLSERGLRTVGLVCVGGGIVLLQVIGRG